MTLIILFVANIMWIRPCSDALNPLLAKLLTDTKRRFSQTLNVEALRGRDIEPPNHKGD